jgi:hypothetical protein
MNDVHVPKKYPRVPNSSEGHWKQWVEGAVAGYGNTEIDSPFAGYAGPLTESLLAGNIAIRTFNHRVPQKNKKGKIEGYSYPERGQILKWDAKNMQVTNFEPANQFVKREYRKGWEPLKI